MECKRVQNLIDAFMDGELDPVHSSEVEGHLRECAGCARGLENRRVLQRVLREKLAYFAAPAELREAAVETSLGRHDVPEHERSGGELSAPDMLRGPSLSMAHRAARRWKIAAWALAACLMVAVGGMTVVMLERPTGDGGMVAAVESAHLRAMLPTSALVDVVSTDRHTVKPWFAGKLAYAPPVPELKGEGFELVGGRLDVLAGERVAALVYRRGQHVIDVFVRPRAEGGKEEGVEEVVTTGRGHHVVRWGCAGFECWAVSDVEGEELKALGRAFEKAVGG
ncbi:MAG: anti-sigma factor family protein [Phycisphaerae bacterium]